ncbi:beta-amyrin 28-monooxygenase-like [Prosopis cineraria]|uniref:beta-amyrin 28-monooxygenase-like n=1 Tax=Prosopis cineraria TaxID=364024 RepID=UPI00240F768C|nr:beta-amyrin 28-monooxygenase-like [Prosopis cineraria]
MSCILRIHQNEDPKGKVRSDDEVADKVMGLTTAAFNSPCIALTFAMKCLAENPQVYQRIRDVMRVIPPLQGTFREATSDFTYDGYIVPKGWKVYWTVSSIKKDPKIFAEPDKFDPTMFEDEIPPFLNMPFGGGPRICPGKDFAKLQMLIYLHYVVTFFKWQLINLNPKVLAAMNAIPLDGVWVRLQRCVQ